MKVEINSVLESVELLHQKIENVFTRTELAAQSLEKIKDILSTDFSMVGLKGNVVTYDTVMTMFEKNAGKRSDLKISVDHYAIIYQSDNTAMVRYNETHNEKGHAFTRCSSALLKRQSHESAWQWVFLHETPVIAD